MHLGHISKSETSKAREEILPLCLALVRWHLEHNVQFQSPQYEKVIDILEQAWWRSLRWSEDGDHDAQGDAWRFESVLLGEGIRQLVLRSSFPNLNCDFMIQ